ncbi:MAG: hypothetical protein HDS77_04080 [Bacteroidales bacterium]|nr:hypothetical protein [Bacteroidales bacterium]MBD5235908.1 hypothetical protein [Barnesiella sp.]MBD5257485.1 hypothetical protein [Barnesiella sp.]
MTDTSNTATAAKLKRRRPDAATVQLWVAQAFALIGLIWFWYPIIGIAHAAAGTILGAMTMKKKPSREARFAVIVGAVALVAAIVMTIIELHSIDIVYTYDASPWT